MLKDKKNEPSRNEGLGGTAELDDKANIANIKLIKRLQDQMQKMQINARELAEKAHVGRSFVYDILSGKSLNPTTKKLSAVADVLGVDVPFLLGQKLGAAKPANVLRENHAAFEDIVSVASVKVEAAMGGGSIVSEENPDKPYFFRASWLRDRLNVSSNDLRIITVRGDSMQPTLFDGDIVLVNVTQKQPTPPGVFVLFDGVGLVVKRLEFVPDMGVVRIISDNPQYSQYKRSPNEINIIGRVVWFAREL